MNPSNQALRELMQGNERFYKNRGAGAMHNVLPLLQKQAIEGQEPKAIVVACADSRVPVEVIFDQSVGDIFCLRVAGQIVSADIIGSIEFAVTALKTRCLIVMGHTNCGAVSAALDSILPSIPCLAGVVKKIKANIAGAPYDPSGQNIEALKQNVRVSMQEIFQQSELLNQYHSDGKLFSQCAYFDLHTGKVELF